MIQDNPSPSQGTKTMKRFYLDCKIQWRGIEYIEYASIDFVEGTSDSIVIEEVKKYFETNNRSVCTPKIITPDLDTSLGLYILIW